MPNKKIAVLPGDGIGPEIMEQALRVFKILDHQNDFEINFSDIGGIAYEKYDSHFPDKTKKRCENAQAILFGSVGGPIEESHFEKWQGCERQSILELRKYFEFNINIRPIDLHPSLTPKSPLKQELLEEGIDFVIIRELSGDIYFGKHQRGIKDEKQYALDTAQYNESQITIIAHNAFKLAENRKRKVTSVDKANVLATSQLWREILCEVSNEYPTVTLEHMLVDNCAMQLILNPKQFDVIVTGNLFGDILSDAASAIPGSLGLMPSASLNQNGFGLYEPSGGSAPHLTGKNIANPIGQILSLAMMLEYSFAMKKEAHLIERAVKSTLNLGFRTRDIYSEGMTLVGTDEITDRIIEQLNSLKRSS